MGCQVVCLSSAKTEAAAKRARASNESERGKSWAGGFTLDRRFCFSSLDLRGMNKRSAGHAPEDQTRLFVGCGAEPHGCYFEEACFSVCRRW